MFSKESLVLVLLFVASAACAAEEVARLELERTKETLKVGNHSYHAESSHATNFQIIVDKDFISFRIETENDIERARLVVLDINSNVAVTNYTFVSPIFSHTLEAHLIISRSQFPDNARLLLLAVTCMKTTFAFRLSDVYALASDVYDLRPHNSSMGVYFVLNVTNTTVHWYVHHRPPIPDFVASILDRDGNTIRSAPVSQIPPDGIGFTDIINRTVPEEKMEIVSLVVTFFESQRNDVAEWHTTQFGDFPREDVDVGDAPVHFRLHYSNKTHSYDLMVLQPFPMQDLIVFVSNASGVIFVEEERFVPYIPASSASVVHYGWVGVLSENMTDDIKIAAFYNKQIHISENRDLNATYMLHKYVTLNGGDVGGITPKVKGNQVGLVTTQSRRKGEIVFAIPYNLVLTNRVAQSVLAMKLLFESPQWSAFLNRSRLAAEQAVVSLALFGVTNSLSPVDGSNFRLMFDSFSPYTPDLPMFWKHEEIGALMSWTVLRNEVEAQLRLWEEEYQVISEVLKPQFGRFFAVEEYKRWRGHLMNKVFEVGNNTFVVAPLVSHVLHSDDPNTLQSYNDEKRRLEIIAAKDISVGELVTADRGTGVKTKHEFLIHHGIVPPSAPDTFGMDGFIVDTKKASRNFVLDARQKKGASRNEAMETFCADLGSLLEKLPSKLEGDKTHVDMMKRIVEGEKRAIGVQIAFCEDERSDL